MQTPPDPLPARPRLLYPSLTPEGLQDAELAFTILVLSDATQRFADRPVEDRRPIHVTRENFERVLHEQHAELNLGVADRLSYEVGAELAVNLRFKRLEDFSPRCIANQIPELRKLLELRGALAATRGQLRNQPDFARRLRNALGDVAARATLTRELGLGEPVAALLPGAPSAAGVLSVVQPDQTLLEDLLVECARVHEEGYDVLKKGLQHLTTVALEPGREHQPVDEVADGAIAEIEARLSAQLQEIFHAPALQRLESSWRALRYLVDAVEPGGNVRVELLPCSKEDLSNDFEDAPEIAKSGLYQHAAAARRGAFRREPVGLIVGDYEFAHGAGDVALLQRLATLATLVHAPFVAAAAPAMFGVDRWAKFEQIRDLKTHFEGPAWARWAWFRECTESRAVALCVPRFLLRAPWNKGAQSAGDFPFVEEVAEREHHLWGNGAFAFAARVADSVTRTGMPSEIVGLDGGGHVGELPRHTYDAMGMRCTAVPTEAHVRVGRELELAEEGFVGLVFHAASGGAVFLSARSCHRPKYFGQSPEGLRMGRADLVATSLTHTLLTSRIAHHVEAMRFERRRDGGDPAAFARDLADWLASLCAAEAPDAAPGVRPLRAARVTALAGDAPSGWWRCEIEVSPRGTWDGLPFSLSIVC